MGFDTYDAVVVGAGPVGCVTALAFASRGAQVVLLEAHPAAATRLAGEWLHPAAVGVLLGLGLSPMTAPSGRPSGRGFVIFPDDDTAPIVLPYGSRPASATARSSTTPWLTCRATPSSSGERSAYSCCSTWSTRRGCSAPRTWSPTPAAR
jgi:2-polyprenyl-6-methoxyphenol hydroxylase-like FAD-dependent oxidoreductase